MIGKYIGGEGAKGLGEGLKVNTTLTSLNLKSGEEMRMRMRKGKMNAWQRMGLVGVLEQKQFVKC